MAATLCLDFGNTRMKYAVFDDDKLIYTGVFKDDGVADLLLCISSYHPGKSILSSVIDHTQDIEKILSEHTVFHKLDHHSRIPITTPVGKPETIGADRLALVVAAAHDFPKNNNLVIGLGSAVTFNYINRFHQFIGGSISPGMEMRFKSLQVFTAKLPLIQPHWNFPMIGYDTKTNIQSGVIFGMAKEIDGVIEAYQEKYANLHVIMTGGDAEYFLPFLKNQITVEPDLIFRGLYLISEYNFSA
jgi:type III pantothenate kinase